MKRFRLKCALVAAAAILGGLLAFLYCQGSSPIWEARATLLAEGYGAAAIPSVVQSPQFADHSQDLSAAPIPGTRLVVLTAQADSPVQAATGLSAALDRLDAMLPWMGDCAIEPILLTDPAPLPLSGTWEICLAGALAGGLLAFLLLFPLPKQEEPLVLGHLVRRWLRLAKKRLIGLLLLCLMVGGGNYGLEALRYSPVCTASTLASIGSYTSDGASTLSTTVSGLLGSDLMRVPGVTAEALGKSNLFILTAKAQTPEAARNALADAMERWPELTIYASRDLTMVSRQAIQVTTPEPFSPGAAWATGCLLGALLWAGLLFLAVLGEPEILTPPPAKRIMNPK